MTSIQSVGNYNLKNKPAEIEIVSKNVQRISFKNDNKDRFVKGNQPVITHPAILNPQERMVRAMEAQQKSQQKERRKKNLMTGLSVTATLLMVVYFGKQLYSEYAYKKDMKKLAQSMGEAFSDVGDALTEQIQKCTNPALKKAAIAEYKKGPQMRSDKKISDILALANLSNRKPEMVDLERVIKIMDERIVDMPEVKESVLEYLIEYNVNIAKGKKNVNPLVLAIDGPAGTGKTTISEVIADALGMPYKKIAMGGATGKSVIRGTESQFVGSEAGSIARGQIDNGTNRVLYLLDEVDKVGKSEQHGSIEAAMLSLFDGQKKFADDFVGVELDLSESIFILTTNEFEKLSKPLRNRIKLIKIAPYEQSTKTKIAKMHLNQAIKNEKLYEVVDVKNDVYEEIARLTLDDGGRETTRYVEELIRKINTMIGLGEMPKGKLVIDKDFIIKNLKSTQTTNTTRERILKAAQEGRLLKPEILEETTTTTVIK